MKVVDFKVIATTGENRRPHSGRATFDDGKEYEWMISPELRGEPEHMMLFGRKKMLAGSEMAYSQLFSFRSAKREEALWKHINSI